MRIDECKVGQVVRGNCFAEYYITDKEMTKGEIVDIKKKSIYVKVLEHKVRKDEIGAVFEVLPQYFEIIEENKTT